jgi:hypothetical protein
MSPVCTSNPPHPERVGNNWYHGEGDMTLEIDGIDL